MAGAALVVLVSACVTTYRDLPEVSVAPAASGAVACSEGLLLYDPAQLARLPHDTVARMEARQVGLVTDADDLLDRLVHRAAVAGATGITGPWRSQVLGTVPTVNPWAASPPGYLGRASLTQLLEQAYGRLYAIRVAADTALVAHACREAREAPPRPNPFFTAPLSAR